MPFDPVGARAYLGNNPIVDVMLDWQRGQIGAQRALQLVAEPAVGLAFEPDQLTALSDRCVRWGYQDHSREAEILHRLLVQVYQVHPSRFAACLAQLAADDLRVATSALWHQPAPDIFARTLGFAEEALSIVAAAADKAILAHELGILHLDPYVASRSQSDMNRWWGAAQRAQEECRDTPAMPEPVQALRKSREWLELALQHLDADKGTAPGRLAMLRLQTLKALIQGACSIPACGVPMDVPYVAALLRQASPLLPLGADNSGIRPYLERVAAAIGMTLAEAQESDPIETDWEAQVGQIGMDLVGDSVCALLEACVATRRANGLELAKRVGHLFERDDASALRPIYYAVVAKLLLGTQIKPPLLDAFRRRTLQRIARQPAAVTRDEDVTTVLAWIHARVAQERETEAFAWLSELCAATPDYFQSWANPVNFLSAQLLVGTGVNAIGAGSYDEAVRQYHRAWEIFIAIGCHEMTLDMMARIGDILPSASTKTATVTCELIREQPAPWRIGVIDDWHAACARIATTATVPMAKQATGDGWFAIARLAKGPAYANQFLATERYHWRRDVAAVQLMDDIANLEREAGLEPRRLEAGYMFEHALASYRALTTAGAGRTPGEQRDLLAGQLDLHVRRKLAALSPHASERFSIDQVQAKLPADTVLLDIFLPTHAEAGAYCLAITADTVGMFATVFQDQMFRAIGIAGDTTEFWSTYAGLQVAQMRELVQQEPAPGRVMSAHAQSALPSISRMMLGECLEWLDSQHAAGKRHLVVVPDGASHFLPFHLLGKDGGTLADNWTVTYLPSMDMLRRPFDGDSGRTGAAVFGLGYSGACAQAGVDPLANAALEAAAVAHALETAPVAEADATPARVLQAMGSARYVHVACHGEHDVVAATLQSLRLTATGGDDGRLYNLDVLGADARGLSVLALSACETGLGRLDAGGNPLGMVASALASGAACVAGTLWPAADDAAALFFSTLFSRLSEGDSRRDAFRQAQIDTRKRYPEYRDWGAFYLTGHW